MQFLDNPKIKESLKEIPIKPVSEAVRVRMTGRSKTSKIYQWSSIAALLILTVSLFTVKRLNQKPSDLPNTDTAIAMEKIPTASSPPETIKVNSDEPRYIFPKTHELVYVADKPYHWLKYIIIDHENIKFDGSEMQVLQPREEQHLVPATIY